ncbi:MAG: nucleoside triphosphate pyrophosphohydrolase [Veillonellaceae bacterium]|mgnify:CR=1 FL=1|jgi:tetrapyrrole methylase family protein/MazG family protein|nr:nucleoside triphosphate pyrophosphohydrolase [Veillonellaceae bacterium]
MGIITIVGLGPGPTGLITAETMEVLKSAQTLILRTIKHPTTSHLIAQGIKFTSYDYLYEEKDTFDEVYQAIVQDCLARAALGQDIIYAVPGSPLVAEKTVELIRKQAGTQEVGVKILPGMSFLEVLYVRLGIDPINGITVIDAADINELPPGLTTGLVVTQLFSRQVASDAKLSLMEYYPDDYVVTLVRNLGLPDETVDVLPLYELDRVRQIDHLTSLYLPPYKEKGKQFTLDPLIDVMARLRAPDGCLWDIEQNHHSLRRYAVEEVYEVLEAIELENADKLCEELGDLLLQIVFHARVAEESGNFSMQDVVNTVTEKMIRRHPHVFGDISVRDAAEVIVNWEDIKKREKGYDRKSVLDGVPKGLPSLMAAYKIQAKAAKVGFDWDNIDPVWGKIQEEILELKEAIQIGDSGAVESELGDVLFAVVNLARFLKAEPEVALTATNNKFRRRFTYIEQQIETKGLKWQQLTLSELDKLWNDAKNMEQFTKK